MRKIKAIIPAAGYATRLYPLTLNRPKPLLEINGKPMIEHVIEKIIEIKEIDEIIIVTNTKFYDSFVDWNNSFECGVPIKIIDDKTNSNENRLGAIGDIYHVIDEVGINEEIIIVNADNLFTFSLKPIAERFFEENENLIALYDVKTEKEASKMGVPILDEKGKVIEFVEKPAQPKSTMISIGIYLYNKKTVALLKQYLEQGNSPDKTGEFIEWLHKNENVFTYTYDNPQDKWFDIGTIEMLEYVRTTLCKLCKKPKKILVTGGAGFIASNVVDLLVEKGYDIVVIDNLYSGYEKNINSKAKHYNIDIREYEKLREVFEKEKPEYVIHAAAQIQVVLSVEKPILDSNINVIGSVNLLECCKEFPVKKFVYLCTGGALYGEPKYLPADEEHPIKPISPYGVSKHSVELYLSMHNKIYGLNFISLRFSNVYGIRDDVKSKRVIPMFVQRFLEGNPPQITGDGKQARDFIYVKDVAKAIVLGLEKDTKDRYINIGSEKPTSINELFSVIAGIIGSDKKPEYIHSRKGEVQQIYLKAQRAKEQLGWITDYTLEKGLTEYIQWVKEGK